VITQTVSVALNTDSWKVEMLGVCFHDICITKTPGGKVTMDIPPKAFELLKEAFDKGAASVSSGTTGKAVEVAARAIADKVPEKVVVASANQSGKSTQTRRRGK
jgi:hypothetical protein